MNKHRIFVAINIPESLKKKLSQYRWPDLPAKWTKSDNLHITLAFLGYIAPDELIDICQAVKEVVSQHNAFEINLSKVCYGPTDKEPGRMVWAIGDKSEEFSLLKQDLDERLGISEAREFFPHITMARIRKWDWKKIEPEERPEVDEEIGARVNVDSIEVMESVLKRGGPEYAILESYKLKK